MSRENKQKKKPTKSPKKYRSVLLFPPWQERPLAESAATQSPTLIIPDEDDASREDDGEKVNKSSIAAVFASLAKGERFVCFGLVSGRAEAIG